ncbi:MAG: hypothetical protein AABY18_10560 [Candidatus Thermoplasmatota archaeon]
MPPDSTLDLEGVPRASRARVAASAPATAAITQERAGPGSLHLWFMASALLLGALVGATAWGVGLEPTESPVEAAAEPLTFGLGDVDLAAGRLISASAAGITVVAIAFAGRSFSRSEVAGLLAATLVALDPSLLAYGSLAVPTGVTIAALAVALACFASPRVAIPWVGALALGFGAFVDPRVLAWGPVLALLAVLRGHIYASPRHLAIAGTQALVIPAIGAFLHVIAEGMWASVPVCLAPASWRLLALDVVIQPGAGMAAIPNPVTWFAGLGAVLFLGIGGAGFGATRFRLARANGRVQARLVSPFPPVFGRGLWLLLLAVAIPTPQALVLVFALALALGVQDLGKDAPGFGLTLAAALLLFAGVVLWRAWGAASGTGGAEGVADAMRLVPWAQPSAC